MAGGRRSILIDARVNGFHGAHGLARSVMKLVAHMSEPADGLALRVLVNPGQPQIFPLSELPPYADVIGTDVTVGAVHRCRELAGLIRTLDAAVLYVPHPTFTPVVRPCPFVVTVHDCTIESDVGFAGGRLRQAGTRLVTGMVLRRAAAMTAPSRASLAEIRRRYPTAPNPTLVQNGVDVRPFGQVTAAAVAAARDRYQLPPVFILAVGAHRPHKNHEVLVRALASVPDHVGLVIVGYFDRSFHDPLPGLIAELGLESRVQLVPDVADEWLPAVFRAASVFAFPSLAEGYGLPVLEAMAAGVPVVMSDIEVLAEVAGPAALMVPPRDVASWAAALVAVLGDAALAGRLTDAGRAAAAAASWDRGALALGRLLSAVAGRRLNSSCITSPCQVGVLSRRRYGVAQGEAQGAQGEARGEARSH
ncbi:MAG: glycosyltransferase family 1 protein [Streptosporangiaceae bacterium]|jgi:glycosyltransferase involved in cell wall biosynthesis